MKELNRLIENEQKKLKKSTSYEKNYEQYLLEIEKKQKKCIQEEKVRVFMTTEESKKLMLC